MCSDNGWNADLSNNIDQESEAFETELIKSLDQERMLMCVIQAMVKYERENTCEACVANLQLPEYYSDLPQVEEIANIVRPHIEDCYEKQQDSGIKPKDIKCLTLLLFMLISEFDFNYRELGEILGKSEAATRKFAARSREKLKPYFKECYKRFIQD